MSSTMEKVSTNKIKLRLELEKAAFEEALQKAYLKMRGRMNVQGFRKGKAPRKLIERMYGESVFYEEAFDAVFPGMYDAAIAEHALKVVGQPEIDIETISAEEGLVILAETYVYPEVTLGAYKGLAVARDDDTVDDEAVDQQVHQMRMRNAREEEVEGRPVQEDDIVLLDYAGTVDGVPFEGGTAQGQTLTIGSGSFIPGFEEQMIGMHIGEEKDINVTFPAEYHEETLAGKEAVFHVAVHGIRVRELAELDDEFAKDVGFDTLEEYKTDIREKLEADVKRNADNKFENELVDAASANASLEVPPPMIETKIDRMINDFSMRMAYQGLRLEDFLTYTGQSLEELREQYREDAENQVKGELVLEAIALAEAIEPTDEEVDAVIARYAESSGKEMEEFKASLTEAQLEYVTEDAKTIAVLDLLKKEAVTPEEGNDTADAAAGNAAAESAEPVEKPHKRTPRRTKKETAEKQPE